MIAPKFMELHRAGHGWRCRGCSQSIKFQARAIGVTGMYGPNRHFGHGSQVLLHPRCVRSWAAANADELPLAGSPSPSRSRASYLREWRRRRVEDKEVSK